MLLASKIAAALVLPLNLSILLGLVALVMARRRQGGLAAGFGLLALEIEQLMGSDELPPGRLRGLLDRLSDVVLTQKGEARKRLVHTKAHFRSTADYERHKTIVFGVGPHVQAAVDEHGIDDFPAEPRRRPERANHEAVVDLVDEVLVLDEVVEARETPRQRLVVGGAAAATLISQWLASVLLNSMFASTRGLFRLQCRAFLPLFR